MPAPITGQVFMDNDLDGAFSTGDVPLAGIPVRIYEVVFNNGFDKTSVTDGNGFYSIDSTGLTPTDYNVQAYVNLDYSFCTIGSNPAGGGLGLGAVVNFAFKNCCTWFWQSRWVRKACWVFPNGQDNPGQFRLTFIDKKKGRIFFKTFAYPQATIAQYAAIIGAPSKGRWVLHNLKGWAKVLVM